MEMWAGQQPGSICPRMSVCGLSGGYAGVGGWQRLIIEKGPVFLNWQLGLFVFRVGRDQGRRMAVWLPFPCRTPKRRCGIS